MSWSAATSTSCRTGREGGAGTLVPQPSYCVFDLLVHRGVDITQQPLLKRKSPGREDPKNASAVAHIRAPFRKRRL